MSIEAMQLALDALEKKNGKWGEGHDKLNAAAIAALKKALTPKHKPLTTAQIDLLIDLEEKYPKHGDLQKAIYDAFGAQPGQAQERKVIDADRAERLDAALTKVFNWER